MLLSCSVGKDSWESLAWHRDQTSQSSRESVLNIHWKDWCRRGSSITLAAWCEELTHLKDPDAGKDWRWEEKGITDDEMVEWHHWLNGHEFEKTLGVGDGQGSLVCCSPWGHKELDTTEWLNCMSIVLVPVCFPQYLPLYISEYLSCLFWIVILIGSLVLLK